MHALLGEFERHHERMIVRARERRAAVELTNLVDAGRVKTSVSEDDLLGKRLPRDEFVGDTNFRTLKALLKKVDERGYERSAHQLEFHENFFKASARVMYKGDWGVQKPRIMQKHGWESCPGEVLIRRASPLCWCLCGPARAPPTNTESLTARSTPRRFGKTFSSKRYSVRCWCPSPAPTNTGSWERSRHLLRLLPPDPEGRDCRVQSSAARLPQALGARHRICQHSGAQADRV